jgi:hypothetical protein
VKTISKKKRLSFVYLDSIWPVIPLEVLAIAELEQDELFEHLPKNQIPFYIENSIQHGKDIAQSFASSSFELKELINKIIKQRVSIHLIQQHPTDHRIRAQYIKKPPRIQIYRTSIQQIKDFFLKMKLLVYEDDIIALHLLHEWFHHLEEKEYGQTDLLFPKIKVKQWGPFISTKTIRKTREIAAHSFTQTALNLKWSPLLLDYLLMLTQQGMDRIQIREHFQELKNRFIYPS